MPNHEIPKLPVIGQMKDGQTVKEHFAEVYRIIGNHFIKQAEVLAGDVSELTSSVSISINLNRNEIVAIDKYTTQIVIGE